MSEGMKGSVNSEYAALIDFIRSQNADEGNEGQQNDTQVIRKREFLRPWKVREVRVNKNGEEETEPPQVPSSWYVFQRLPYKCVLLD